MPRSHKDFYGVGHTTCARCGKGMQTHAVNGCDITSADESAVETLIRTARAISGASEGSGPMADRMVGALVAKTGSGRDIKLLAMSGPASLPIRVSGWTISTVAVPMTRTGWTDVYGRLFDLPATVAPGNPCAAIKLLMGLGRIYATLRNPNGYNWIHLYEEAVREEVVKTDHRGREKKGKSTRLTRYRGESRSFTYAAHSCDGCSQRIPLLLCDRPTA